MKNDYSKSITLRCITCGGEDFEFNEDKSYVKCNLCNREYFGGYDELIELNEESITEGVEAFKAEVISDIEKDITDMFKKAFSGNKFIKIK
ncbi:MAG: hypothetical protein IJC16_05800 [Rikenellaceae bacterium]|nr:hypothetical protein [Rikenellaceae bacterium]